MATASNGRLVFKHPFTGSARLVFGRSTGPVVETYELAGHIALPDPVIGGELRNAWPVAGHIALPAPVFSGALQYDVNVSRGPAAGTVARWQDAGAADRPLQSHWQDATRVQTSATEHAQDALLVDAAARDCFQDTQRRSADTRQRWQDGAALDTVLRDAFQYAEQRSSSTAQHWQDAHGADRPVHDRFQNMLVRRGGVLQRFQEADLLVASFGQWGGYALPIWSGNTQHWQDARQPPPGQCCVLHPPIEPPHLCYDPATLGRLVFRRPFTGSGRLVFICYRHVDPVDPVDPTATVVVPVKRYYMIVTSASLVRLDTGAIIQVTSLSIGMDADSWSCTFNASIAGNQLNLLKPNSNGDPVILRATINGTPFNFLAENLSRSRAHPRTDFSLRGRSLSAELDTPNAPIQVFGNSGARTAEQLLGDILTYNGVGIGWSVPQFGLTDWVVPANVFSHQGSYISAINQVVGSVGGYVQAHDTERELKVLHRYPTPPWEWGAVTPDFELPSAVVKTDNFEWITKPDYNRVYVSGQEGGVSGRYTRDGTAGDVLADSVVDPLITDVIAVRQRGRAIVGDSGKQRTVTLSLPVLNETGIIRPGQFVRYVDDLGPHIGLTRGTNVSVALPNVVQSILLEVHGH